MQQAPSAKPISLKTARTHFKTKSIAAKIALVAFSPQNNGWIVINDKGERSSNNIPSGCKQDVDSLSRNGNRVTCVAFPPQGGDSWTVINSNGGYFNRNPPAAATVYMDWFSQAYGPLRLVVYDTDGGGWSVIAQVTSNESVPDGFTYKRTHILDMYKSIQSQLADKVVGYACTIGSTTSHGAFSWGQSRTNADAPAYMYLPSTKTHVASVSKFVTALATIRFLPLKGKNLGNKIGDSLPSFWKLDSNVFNLTFRQLLSHTSGIKEYGADTETYDGLKDFFESLNDKSDPKVWLPDNEYTYSNWNFGIFRVLLPIIDGFSDFSWNFQWPLADRYIQIVQTTVFEPVGVKDVVPKPPSSGYPGASYAYAYKWPGSSSGMDHGDMTGRVGAYGWWLSINDVAAVLNSLNANDGRILSSSQLTDMRALPSWPGGTVIGSPMGFDNNTNDGTSRWSQKAGYWGADGVSINTSVALLSGGLYAALFVNSDIVDKGFQDMWKRCIKCQAMTSFRSSNKGDCPAGDLHDLGGAGGIGGFRLPMGQDAPPGGQPNWRYCWKCEGLVFAGGSSVGKCPGGAWYRGYDHDHGSDEYFLQHLPIGGVLPAETTDQWRYCRKCQVLAFNGTLPGASTKSLGTCKEGGIHDHSTSGNYEIKQYIGADLTLFDAYQSATW